MYVICVRCYIGYVLYVLFYLKTVFHKKLLLDDCVFMVRFFT